MSAPMYNWLAQDGEMNIITTQQVHASPQNHATATAPAPNTSSVPSAPPPEFTSPLVPASAPVSPPLPAVLPEAPPMPQEGEAPPPYTTLPRSPSDNTGATWAAVAGQAYAARGGVRLGYVDFVPRVLRKRVLKEDEYESFDVLITRANTWLEDNQGIQVVSCETVVWMGLKTKNIFSDSAMFARSMNASKSTKYLQGLRMWYFSDIFPSAHQRLTAALQCKTYVPRKGERFDQLINRVNEHLAKERLGGKIISVETVRLSDPNPDDPYASMNMNPNRSFWKELPDDNKRCVLSLRVYATVGESREGYETIGYQDFSPEHNQRNQENEGYETFSDVMSKASRWVARQQGVQFVNVQSFSTKVKKKGPFEERCIYTEHLCANNRTNVFKGPNRATHYLRMIRAYFLVQNGSSSGGGNRAEFPSVRLTYRTFTPAQITAGTTTSPPEYEGMRQLLDRINQWLQITGAKAFNFETVAMRVTTGSLQLLGPEATYSQNGLPCGWSEKWMYHIRVYLDGEYMEPPGAISLVLPSMSVITRVH